MNKLDEICATKRQEVTDRKSRATIGDLDAAALLQSAPRGFEAALRKASRDGFGLIAEIKKASPSKGLIRADFDPAICNREILSVWFAFWGEQAFVPQYGEITREYDDNRSRAIQKMCQDLLPGDADRAANIADWIDTLTDGYWQNLYLFPANYSNASALESSLKCLAALLPEFAEKLGRL